MVHFRSSFDIVQPLNALTPASVPGQQVSLGVAGFHGTGGVCSAMGWMLAMKRKRHAVLISLAFCASGCNAEDIKPEDMKLSEESFGERQRTELVAYMSLDTLFPDRRIRALAEAAAKGDVEKLEALADQGIDVNSRGTKDATPLFWAMRSDSIDGFKKLLELGADPNVILQDGGTVIHWAAQLENSEFLRSALQHGGDPNLIAGEGRQAPIFKAVGSSGDSDQSAVTVLLEHGADPNVKDARGNTPAMIAAGVGRFDIVYALLNRGADHSLRNEKGYNLLDRISAKRNVFVPGSAEEESLERVIAWLSERGVTVPE